MLIDFSKIEEVHVPNFKGGEKELLKKAYADGRNCIMLDRLMPGASIGRHTHETNSEIMYIVSGTATFTVGDTVETVQAGQCHYCPKGGTHMLQNRGGDLVARQLLGAMCLNKTVSLPPRFCLLETANDLPTAQALPGIAGRLDAFAAAMQRSLCQPAGNSSEISPNE